MKGNITINEQLLTDENFHESEDFTQKESKSFCSFLYDFKFPIISALMSIVLFVVPIIIFKKDIYTKYIDAPKLEVIDNRFMFAFWVIHCIGLIVLPILMKCLFKDKLFQFYYFIPPIMMLVNDLCYCMPVKCYWIPSIIEYLISLILFLELPFKTIYIWKFENFWFGELTLMFLTFVSISASLSASTLSYILFGRYIRIDEELIPYPSNPKNAISFVEYVKYQYGDYITGAYLSCYSLFTIFSIGHGFLMTFKNSVLMIIPFLLLAISTISSFNIIGLILFCQIIIHILYILFLQCDLMRVFLSEFGEICGCEYVFRKTGKKSITTILIGDIITFLIFVFPVFAMVLDGDKAEFPWKYFIGGICVLCVGATLHIYNMSEHESPLVPIFASIFIAGSVYLFGFGFKGYVPFIKAYTFSVTSLSWSIMLDIIAWKCGHSPFIYLIYRGFIIVASLITIELLECIGLMEIIFGVVQFIMDEFIIGVILENGPENITWVLFASVGIGTFCPIPFGAAFLIFYIFNKCCC